MLKIDLHIHTINSGHAFNTLHEIAKEASKRKMKMIAITDHSSTVPPNYLDVGIHVIPKNIYGVRVLFGVEASILKDGKLDLDDETLKKLDVVLAGFHKETYASQTINKNTETMIKAIRNPDVHIISHPYNNMFPVDTIKIAEEACRYDKLLELNCQYFKYPHKIPDKEVLLRIKKMIEIIKKNKQKLIINSDAHILSDVGDDSDLMKYKKVLGFTDKDIINNYPDELKEHLNIK